MTTYGKVNLSHDADYRRQNPQRTFGETIGIYTLTEKNYGFQCARCDEVELVKECPNCGKTRYIAGYLEGAVGVFCDKCGIGWSSSTCKKCGTETASARSFVKEDSCFIATAVTDTPNSWQVHTLRQFRDNVLDQTKSGRNFVHWYYAWSPAAASQLPNHPTLKTVTKYLVSLLSIIAVPITWMAQRIQSYKHNHR